MEKKLSKFPELVLVPVVNIEQGTEETPNKEAAEIFVNLESDEFFSRRRGKSRKNEATLRILIRAYQNYDGHWSDETFE